MTRLHIYKDKRGDFRWRRTAEGWRATLYPWALAALFFAFSLWVNAAPILQGQGPVADPLPPALVLTAIVIGFATTGFLIELALRSHHEAGSDHVDGHEPDHPPGQPSPADDREVR